MVFNNPYLNNRFQVSILDKDGHLGDFPISFSEVSEIADITEDFQVKEITRPTLSYKIPLITKAGNVTLRRGTSESLALYEWRGLVKNSKIDSADFRKTVIIYVKGFNNRPNKKIVLSNAWPSRISMAGLNALNGEILYESVVLEYEDFTIDVEPY